MHWEPASSVKALAGRLGRDYKRVYEDVETLAASGRGRPRVGSLRCHYSRDAPAGFLLTDGSCGKHWNCDLSGTEPAAEAQ
jgi:hypothetical protein